jgi:hypothetical protein
MRSRGSPRARSRYQEEPVGTGGVRIVACGGHRRLCPIAHAGGDRDYQGPDRLQKLIDGAQSSIITKP